MSTATAAAAVSVTSANKRFGQLQVLKDVSLAVTAGEVVVICGPSGSGKSTLIRSLCGLERLDSGEVLIVGERLRHTTEGLLAVRRKVGMVFQAFNLFYHLTVLENLILAPVKVRGLQRRDAEAKARQLLQRVGIPEKESAFPEQLSGGQQQRVAIARALCMEPAVMLFDEPTSALDPEMIKEVLDVIRDLATEGRTLLVVTHEMGFARGAADRVLFMDAGEIVEEAPPAEFFANPREQRTRSFIEKILAH